MHHTLQHIWTRVQEIHHKYPPLPPSFSQLCPTPETSAGGKDSYSTILTNIQQQLQKRRINVDKIKMIGEGLHDKLTEDIAVLHDNHQILVNLNQIQRSIDQCEARFVALVQEVVGKYRGLMGDADILDAFDVFVTKYYYHYCTTVDKEIIVLYQHIIQEINMLKLPSNMQVADVENTSFSYIQSFPTLIQVLTKFRSMLTTEYQVLLNTRSNTEQQCRAAVLFLSKLRTLFMEMKDVLWDKASVLNSVYQFALLQKRYIMEKLKASYRKYIRQDNQRKRQSSLFEDSDKNNQTVSYQDDQHSDNESVISKQISTKIRKINYIPSQQWAETGLYYACHSQILQYLYLTTISGKQLANLDHNITRVQQMLFSSLLTKSNQSAVQASIKQIKNKIIFLADLANIGWFRYFQKVKHKSEQYANMLDKAKMHWDNLQIFISKFGKICPGLLARVKEIGMMQKKLELEECNNICIQLYGISQTFKQIITFMQKSQLNNVQLKNVITSQISACQQLRTLFYNSHKINPRAEQLSKKMQSSSVAQHILIEEQPVQEPDDEVNVEDEVSKMMQYVDKSTEFYEYELKSILAGGYELIVYHLEKSASSKIVDAKIQKLQKHINNLMQMSKTHTRLLFLKQKQQNSLNLTQIRRQCESATFNTKILHILLSTSYIAASGKSIINIYDECINFEYQDWQSKIKQFQSQLKIFHTKCKQVYQLQMNNTTSLFSIVYRILKEYISTLQIIYDIFEETLYMFRNCKQLQLARKGNIHNKSINISSQQDLNYLTDILAFKIKINEQISQIDKFNNISKLARNYLKSIYLKFRNNYNGYIPFEDALLRNLIKKMQSAIGFAQSHGQIFRIYEAAAKKAAKDGNKKQLDQLWEMSKEIIELQKQNKAIEQLSQIRLSIDMRSLQQLKRIFKLHSDQFKFALIVNELHETQGKSRIATDPDAKNRAIYNNIIEAFRNYYR